MKRIVVCSLAAWVCLGSVAVRAEQAAPRDIWPQAAAAAETGDLDGATRKMNELTAAARDLGIHTLPVYAAAAASVSRQAAKENATANAAWASRAADQRDPAPPAVAFTKADQAGGTRQSARALPATLKGYGGVFRVGGRACGYWRVSPA